MTRHGDGPEAIGAPWRGAPIVLSLAVGVIQVVGTYFASHDQTGRRSFDALAVVLLAAGPAALAVRRRYPVAVLLCAFGVTLAYFLLDYPRGPIWLALIVSFVGVVMSGRRAVAAGVAVVGYAAFLWLPYLAGDEPAPETSVAVGVAAWILVILTLAEVARTRRERAMEAQRSRAEQARRRASEERLRIAQELHDVLAHNISLISVQAGVALHLIDDRPEQARSALAAIKQASNEALGELRSVLEVLRRGDEEPPRYPTSGLDHLDDLVARTSATGVAVRKSVGGSPRPLPAGVDLAAFRIVQEALTNVTRHAGASSAVVRVVYGEREVVVQVDDDGRGSSPRPSGAGRGLAGMRERAAALGGDLEAGPRPGGGFRVRARLPVEPSGAQAPR